MSNVRSPGLETFDIGLQKWFTWREYLKLQFRAELFNAFNRANFNNPNTNIQGGSFGLVTTAGSGRSMLFGLRLDY